MRVPVPWVRWSPPPAATLLVLAYGSGLVGALWEWRAMLSEEGTRWAQPLAAGGVVLALIVMLVAGRSRRGALGFLVLGALATLGALAVLMPAAMVLIPAHSTVNGVMMGWMATWMMRPIGLLFFLPLVLVALWAAWRWLRSGPALPWRIAAAAGIVVVAVGAEVSLA